MMSSGRYTAVVGELREVAEAHGLVMVVVVVARQQSSTRPERDLGATRRVLVPSGDHLHNPARLKPMSPMYLRSADEHA